jgi:hypothetical protein
MKNNGKLKSVTKEIPKGIIKRGNAHWLAVFICSFYLLTLLATAIGFVIGFVLSVTLGYETAVGIIHAPNFILIAGIIGYIVIAFILDFIFIRIESIIQNRKTAVIKK